MHGSKSPIYLFKLIFLFGHFTLLLFSIELYTLTQKFGCSSHVFLPLQIIHYIDFSSYCHLVSPSINIIDEEAGCQIQRHEVESFHI